MAAVSRIDTSAEYSATRATAITPHNTDELTYVTRALYVGVAGNVKVKMQGGDEVTFVGVAAGSTLPIRVCQVFLTGTTATNILGLE